ncbi:PREDICTED: F-box/LRR-repeat protein 6-like isoform X4 [Branchiostoma belcheri]|uniref:F-box/LRR-repeat protein 6-like isoform X4 n=1 Tax=Branchiostoma belcheri TaxID=7741 RepID=A0A6P4YFR6_BRABE|nr:PREDICTED: F-box/LRR-repeat protein 6-like isoform X4 [Branchiostoma belcheri]
MVRSRSERSPILNIVESEHDYISSPEKEEKSQEEVEYSSEVEDEEKACLKHDHDYTELISEEGPSNVDNIVSENEPMQSGRGKTISKNDTSNQKKGKSSLKSTLQENNTLSSAADKKNKKTAKKRVRFEDIPEDKKPIERKGKRAKSRMDAGSSEEGQQWGQRLPVEVIVNMLQFAVADQGAVPLLCRVAKVCHFWYEATKHPSLWRHVDLSTGHVLPNARSDKTLQWLAENRFSQLRSLNLSHWVFLTRQGIQSHMVSPTCVKYVLEKTGPRLKELNLSSNKLMGAPGIFKCIASCPQLEVLDLSNCHFSSTPLLPIEVLQTGCPRLRVLRLAGTDIAAGNATLAVQDRSPGFPELREVSLASNTLLTSTSVNNDFICRLLKTSYKLKLLDLRGCSNISTAGLQSLPVTCLELFFISNTSNIQYSYEGIEVIIQKCQHSLVEVDLSWNLYEDTNLDRTLRKLSSCRASSQLKVLSLSGTCVTSDMVRSVLEGCPHLTSLNLTSCRALPRGMKQLFGEQAIADLRRQIC